MVGNDTIMPINLQHFTPQDSGHLAIVSQQECSLEAFLPWQSFIAALDDACAAARAEPTGARPTASAIRAARTIRYMPSDLSAAIWRTRERQVNSHGRNTMNSIADTSHFRGKGKSQRRRFPGMRPPSPITTQLAKPPPLIRYQQLSGGEMVIQMDGAKLALSLTNLDRERGQKLRSVMLPSAKR